MQKQPVKRVVIAGQIPPPFGGQAVMIGRLMEEMSRREGVNSAHWAFYFTKNVGQARRVGLGKIVELLAALWRLVKLRLAGPIDLMIYPAGGPQFVPVVRDLCLLPFALLASRRLVIHFHAGGIAEGLPRLPAPLRRALQTLCRRADAALVMTEFGKRDPQILGIERIVSVPHALEDRFDPSRGRRGGPKNRPARLLYMGHLCADKGTPALLQAVAALRASGVDCQLDLVGECLTPYTAERLRASLAELGLENAVERPGVLSGEAKWERFARADLFVFPSVAPYESFGLVMAEAMMWALPVVASDWRGNREVLGEPPGGVCFDPQPDLTKQLSAALAQAFAQRELWPGWGEANRRAYERRFRAQSDPDRLPRAIESLL